MAETTNWKDKLTFLTPNYIERTIGDQTFRFYPVSVVTAFKLRRIAKPLSKALSNLFTSKDRDFGTVHRKLKEGDEETIVEALTPAMAKTRVEQKGEAMQELVEALTSDENIEVLGELIISSLRETFPPGDKANPPAREFVSTLPLPRLVDLLWGVALANKDVLGPLTDRLHGLFSQIGEKVKARVEERAKEI